ncbi:hypothetical protein AB0F81_36380 [Actinoplanes sp. NPDC024001]|uniref:hypothetical protein n=1 Tax=Actinoplanes sp. NPDC024001 TaxID=3154598 RepID=UPI0033D1C1DB
MHNGDNRRNTLRIRAAAGALALTASLLAGCTSDSEKGSGTTAAPQPTSGSAAASAPAATASGQFGPEGFGKVTIALPEKEALATGELQAEPVSTVLGRNVYSFTGGPKPDASRMAADEEIEKNVLKADNDELGDAETAEAYAKSARRIEQRLADFLEAGGAAYTNGKLVALAAPKEAVTEAGVKRGSKVAELTAAYQGKGLQQADENMYEMPVAGHVGWTMRFEVEDGVVLFMSIGQAEEE